MTSDEQNLSLRAALEELAKVLGGIVAMAEENACERCPYMNVQRECTAEFSCINQASRVGHTRPFCSGQHKINFSPNRNSSK